MIALHDIGLSLFLLPEDGPLAHATFLSLLRNPHPTWISAYALTDGALLEEIRQADARGVEVHLLLDHTQSTGHTEAPAIQALHETLQHGDITITTAGDGSTSTGAIHHEKCMVVEDPEGEPFVWTGSINFSQSGWLQGNQAVLFRSREAADAILTQFKRHQTWAREHQAQYQLPPSSAAPAAASR